MTDGIVDLTTWSIIVTTSRPSGQEKPGRAAFSISKNWIERGDDMQQGRIHSIESMGLVDGLESVPFFFCRGAVCGAATAITLIHGSSPAEKKWM